MIHFNLTYENLDFYNKLEVAVFTMIHLMNSGHTYL